MKNAIRVVLILIGIIGVSWFILPFYTYGILGIGNMTGVAVFLLFVLYGIFMEWVNKMLAKLSKNRIGGICVCIVGGMAAVIIVLVVIETFLIVTAALKKPTENSTLIVLGCKVNGGSPSMVLAERLDAAYEYLTDNPDAVCVVSGGQGADEVISEAECMYRYLVNRGIDAERIYKEDKSTTTIENLEFSREIIEKYNLNPNIAIATSEFHEYRAGETAKKLGFEYGAVSGQTNLLLLPTYYVRELYAILFTWVLYL